MSLDAQMNTISDQNDNELFSEFMYNVNDMIKVKTNVVFNNMTIIESSSIQEVLNLSHDKCIKLLVILLILLIIFSNVTENT